MAVQKKRRVGNGRSLAEASIIRFGVGACSLGYVLVAATEAGACAIFLGDKPKQLERSLRKRFEGARIEEADAGFDPWIAAVAALMEQPEKGLNLAVDIHGTPFQASVWKALCDIPVGATASYAEIARRIGRPTAARAVAQACAANPLAVVVPCHRVVRTDRSLSGYRWGVERKSALLKRERRTAAGTF